MTSVLSAFMAHPMAPDEGPLLYKIPDVMRMLNMSRRSVEVLIATGQLKSHKILGSRRISRGAVDELLRQTEVQIWHAGS